MAAQAAEHHSLSAGCWRVFKRGILGSRDGHSSSSLIIVQVAVLIQVDGILLADFFFILDAN